MACRTSKTELAVLAELAGDAWTPEIQDAWQEALDLITHTMLEAKEEVHMSPEATVATNSPAANGAVDRYFDALSVPAFIVDERAKVMQWNAAVQELTGKTADEMYGKKAWTAFFDKKRPNPVDAALIGEEEEEDEAFEFENEDGETITTHFKAVPIFSADGEVEGATVTLGATGGGGASNGDALQNADNLGQVKAISKSQAVIHFNLDGTIIEANDNFLNAMGYTLAEVQGQHHSMFADPEYRASPEYTQFWAALSRGEYQAGEFKRLGKGGKEVWLQASYNPIMDTEGKPFKVVKYAADITETRRQADQAGRLQSAIEGSATATMMVDRDLEITYANPATVDLVGKNLEEFRATFPGFDLDHLIGTCIDSFHKDPSHQRRILNDPRNLPYQADIQVGKLTFALNITAITSSDSEYIGNNLEWADVTKAKAEATRATSLFSMIEGASAYFMMCDLDLQITYLNPSLKEMLTTYQPALRGLFPSFDVNNLLGFCIDGFHENPSHQRRLLANINNMPFKTEINVGGLEFGLTLTALMDVEGNHIGNAVEWADLNARVTYRKEVESLIEESKLGNLAYRADLEKLDEVYQPMMEGIHEIIEGIVEPIQEAAGVLEEVANRDLTARITGDYQGDHARIKDSLNQAAENLDSGLTQVALAADQVSAASGEISDGSQALAQGASEQASSLEQIGSSLEEVSSMTKQNSANAQEARSLTENAQEVTTRGVDSMGRLSEAINKIKTSADQTAKIIKTIDEIAFQTNLLALNAAVEAARAGEAGKGFAVVAEEVRNLAMRSAEAAKNTSELIEGSVKNAEGGVQLNQEVLEHLEEIDTQVQKVNAMVAEIATSSDQQNMAIVQISTGVEQMNQVTQQNAASAEESASASEELSAQSAELQGLVGAFTLSEAAAVAPPQRSAPLKRSPMRQRPASNSNGTSRAAEMIPLDDEDMESLSQF